MKTILEHINDLPRSEWDYYYDINKLNELQNELQNYDFNHFYWYKKKNNW